MAELSALLAEYRRRADDSAEQPLMPDEDAVRLFAEAEREACLRSSPIYDTTTPEFTRYAVAAGSGQVRVSLPLQVLRIDAAAFTPNGTTREEPVELTGIDRILEAQWCRAVTSARPSYAAHAERYAVTLFPAPNQGGTLRLSVYRLPRYDLEALDDEPEIPAELHEGLVDWVLYRTYQSKDGEQEDPARAANALAAFTERFGERVSADVMRKHNERRRITTRMQRF